MHVITVFIYFMSRAWTLRNNYRRNLVKLLSGYINLFHSAASEPLCLPSEVCVWHRHQSGGGAGRLLRGRGVHRQTECDGSTQPSRDTGSHFPQTRSAMMRLTSSSSRRFHTMSLSVFRSSCSLLTCLSLHPLASYLSWCDYFCLPAAQLL